MKTLVKTVLAGSGILAALPALAHTGHELTTVAGLLHPFHGSDHLLAMTGVGILAASRSDGTAWTLPVAFVAALVIGVFSGLAGLTLTVAEPGILASLIVFGLLIATGSRLVLPVILGITAVFGFAHGAAHGVEAAGASFAYVAAFAGTSAALHGTGWVFGRVIRLSLAGRCVSGLAISATGVALFFS